MIKQHKITQFFLNTIIYYYAKYLFFFCVLTKAILENSQATGPDEITFSFTK